MTDRNEILLYDGEHISVQLAKKVARQLLSVMTDEMDLMQTTVSIPLGDN